MIGILLQNVGVHNFNPGIYDDSTDIVYLQCYDKIVLKFLEDSEDSKKVLLHVKANMITGISTSIIVLTITL